MPVLRKHLDKIDFVAYLVEDYQIKIIPLSGRRMWENARIDLRKNMITYVKNITHELTKDEKIYIDKVAGNFIDKISNCKLLVDS